MTQLSPGQRVQSDSGTDVIVVKAMVDAELTFEPGEAVKLGKRYLCGTCGSEVLVTKAGSEQVSCHGVAMEMAASRQLPSSD
jgi:hypothetical protein